MYTPDVRDHRFAWLLMDKNKTCQSSLLNRPSWSEPVFLHQHSRPQVVVTVRLWFIYIYQKNNVEKHVVSFKCECRHVTQIAILPLPRELGWGAGGEWRR